MTEGQVKWSSECRSGRIKKKRKEKKMDLGCSCPGNWFVSGRWKTGTAGKKTMRVYETGGKVKLSRDVEKGRKRQKGAWEIYSQGEEYCISSPYFCAIQMTAGLSCPRLFYIKLRQMLDFPHYGYSIWLIQFLSMFLLSSASIQADLLSEVAGYLPPVHCYRRYKAMSKMYTLPPNKKITRHWVCHSILYDSILTL